MTTHELKTWPPHFADVLADRKTFEARRDDRGFKVGDVLRLREWQPRDDHPEGGWHTGRECWREVTYVTRGRDQDMRSLGLPASMCIMSIANTESSTRARLSHQRLIDESARGGEG